MENIGFTVAYFVYDDADASHISKNVLLKNKQNREEEGKCT